MTLICLRSVDVCTVGAFQLTGRRLRSRYSVTPEPNRTIFLFHSGSTDTHITTKIKLKQLCDSASPSDVYWWMAKSFFVQNHNLLHCSVHKHMPTNVAWCTPSTFCVSVVSLWSVQIHCNITTQTKSCPTWPGGLPERGLFCFLYYLWWSY